MSMSWEAVLQAYGGGGGHTTAATNAGDGGDGGGEEEEEEGGGSCVASTCLRVDPWLLALVRTSLLKQ
jgi:hypothetical protein